MPKKITKQEKIKDISLGQYQHIKAKRTNNPQVGLVTSSLDTKPKKKTYQHDPYIDPTLSWSGKTEGVSFDVDTVSLHIHERIDPKRIIKQVLKKDDQTKKQASLFEDPNDNLSLDLEFDFYSHNKNWSNRLIAGDSLLVMNSLIEKEKMAGKVQMIYMDPPYGIKYNSNFQPFTNKRDVKNSDDDSIPTEPEMIKAFRDIWELGIHSYLTNIKNRLLLAKSLLHESGSIFVQISDENIHHIREILDEVFGAENFIAIIAFQTATNQNTNTIQRLYDYVIWYSASTAIKVRTLFRLRTKEETESTFNLFDEKNKRYKAAELKQIWDLELLKKCGRLTENNKYAKRFPTDFEYTEYKNVWDDTVISTFSKEKIYVVQTNRLVIERCMLMVTDPGDLILDITCGSGTTAYVSEQWGRRWITCDTSRVAIQLAKQRLMTAKFEYYLLAQDQEGVSSGFKYKTVPHLTLNGIATNKLQKDEILYDNPLIDKKKVRVTGPFTVEAVPGVRTKPIDGELPDISDKINPTNLIAEKINDYLDSIRTSGIRSYHNDGITFDSVEIAEGFKEIHAFGMINNNGEYKKCAIIFGPDYAPMEQTQVERTMDEIREMEEKPQLVIFCSYAFDPEASKDIDNIKISDLEILKAQMNTDLLIKDLKNKASTNKPFWLIGEPDIEIIKNKDGKYQVEVKGFDYYDPHTQELKAGSIDKIAMWMLDTDYDNRSLFPSQIFFPMCDEKRDWTKLAKALNGKVDTELLEQYTGNISIPFELGEKKTIAVKIIDDRGVEMLIVNKL